MRGMNLSKWGIVWVLVMVSGIASAANLEDLLSLHGEEYMTARDELLGKGVEINSENKDDRRMLLMVEILNERIRHPELFIKLSDIVKKCTAPKPPRTARQSSPLPYISLTGAAKSFMRQGIEMKKYVTYESPTGGISDRKRIEHIQTDEEVTQSKELNHAARLAVIEYLWKISEDWRVDYELSDIFAMASKEYAMPYLPVFSDVFRRSTHFLVLENCAKIFVNANYAESLPWLREKLEQCLGEKQHLSCLVILPALEMFGEKKDTEKMDKLLEIIAKEVKVERWKSDWIFNEIEYRIEARTQARSSQDAGLQLD